MKLEVVEEEVGEEERVWEKFSREVWEGGERVREEDVVGEEEGRRGFKCWLGRDKETAARVVCCRNVL